MVDSPANACALLVVDDHGVDCGVGDGDAGADLFGAVSDHYAAVRGRDNGARGGDDFGGGLLGDVQAQRRPDRPAIMTGMGRRTGQCDASGFARRRGVGVWDVWHDV